MRCGNGQRNHRIDVGLKRDSADNLFHADAPTAVCLQCAARYRTALEIQIADQISLCGAHCKFDRAAFANLTFRAVIIGRFGTRVEGILCVVGRQIKQRYILKIHLHLAVFGRSERESVGELVCCRAVYRPRLNHLTGIRCGGQRQRSALGYLNAAGGINGRAIRAFNGQLAAVTADGRKRHHLADTECCVNGVVLRHVVQVECQRVASCCAIQRPAGQICAAARLCGENNRRMVRNGQLAASNSNVCTVYFGRNRATAADIDGDGVCRNRHKADVNRGVAGQRVNDIGCALLRTDGSGACRVCVPVFDHIARIGHCRKRNARAGFCFAVCVRTGNRQRAVIRAAGRDHAVGYGVFRVRDFVARNDFGVLGDGQGVGRCIGFVHRAVYLPADEGVAACRCGRGERDFGITLDGAAACQRFIIRNAAAGLRREGHFVGFALKLYADIRALCCRNVTSEAVAGIRLAVLLVSGAVQRPACDFVAVTQIFDRYGQLALGGDVVAAGNGIGLTHAGTQEGGGQACTMTGVAVFGNAEGNSTADLGELHLDLVRGIAIRDVERRRACLLLAVQIPSLHLVALIGLCGERNLRAAENFIAALERGIRFVAGRNCGKRTVFAGIVVLRCGIHNREGNFRGRDFLKRNGNSHILGDSVGVRCIGVRLVIRVYNRRTGNIIVVYRPACNAIAALRLCGEGQRVLATAGQIEAAAGMRVAGQRAVFTCRKRDFRLLTEGYDQSSVDVQRGDLIGTACGRRNGVAVQLPAGNLIAGVRLGGKLNGRALKLAFAARQRTCAQLDRRYRTCRIGDCGAVRHLALKGYGIAVECGAFYNEGGVLAQIMQRHDAVIGAERALRVGCCRPRIHQQTVRRRYGDDRIFTGVRRVGEHAVCAGQLGAADRDFCAGQRIAVIVHRLNGHNRLSVFDKIYGYCHILGEFIECISAAGVIVRAVCGFERFAVDHPAIDRIAVLGLRRHADGLTVIDVSARDKRTAECTVRQVVSRNRTHGIVIRLIGKRAGSGGKFYGNIGICAQIVNSIADIVVICAAAVCNVIRADLPAADGVACLGLCGERHLAAFGQAAAAGNRKHCARGIRLIGDGNRAVGIALGVYGVAFAGKRVNRVFQQDIVLLLQGLNLLRIL